MRDAGGFQFDGGRFNRDGGGSRFDASFPQFDGGGFPTFDAAGGRG
jgi:hypothetical protein